MDLVLHFTEKEVEDFLLSKGFKTFIKMETINYGPYGKQESEIGVKYVSNIIGTVSTQKEIFEGFMKRRLLTW